MKRPLLLLLAFFTLGGLYYFLKLYNKQHIDVESTEATLRIDANVLFGNYDTLTNPMFDLYSDMVLEVVGAVESVDTSNTKEPQIVLNTSFIDGYIRCGLDSASINKVHSIERSDTLIVKGICKGFLASDELDLLMDREVVLSNCIIIE